MQQFVFVQICLPVQTAKQTLATEFKTYGNQSHERNLRRKRDVLSNHHFITGSTARFAVRLIAFVTDFSFNLIYLFMSRHEVHSMNTHTLQNAG